MFVGLIHAAKIGNFAGRNQYAARVHTQIARQIFQFQGKVEQLFGFFFPDDLFDFGFGGQGIFKVQRFVGFQRNQLGEAVAQCERQLQHAPHVPNHGFGRHGAEGNDLADRFPAVFGTNVFDHAPPVGLAEIDIKIGHGHAFGIEETLEQQRVFERVEVGDFERIRHQRACARTAPRPYGAAVVFRPVDEVLHDEEIAGKLHLDDDVQLKIQPLLVFGQFGGALRFVGIKHGQPFTQPFVGKVAQIVVQIHAFGRGEQRQKVFAQCEREVAAFGDFRAVGQCAGNIGKAALDFFGGGKILAGHEIVRTFGIVQRPTARNAHADIVRLIIFALQKLHGMGGDDGQILRGGNFQAA